MISLADSFQLVSVFVMQTSESYLNLDYMTLISVYLTYNTIT